LQKTFTGKNGLADFFAASHGRGSVSGQAPRGCAQCNETEGGTAKVAVSVNGEADYATFPTARVLKGAGPRAEASRGGSTVLFKRAH